MKRCFCWLLVMALAFVPVVAMASEPPVEVDVIPDLEVSSEPVEEPPAAEPLEPVGEDSPAAEELPPADDSVQPEIVPEEIPGEGEEGIEDEIVGNMGPYPVYIVEAPEMETEGEIEVLADRGSAYPGTISTNVYQYFRAIAANLPFGQHYVFFREDRYRYFFAYSDELEVSGDTFSAPSVRYFRFDTDTYDTDDLTQGTESNFEVSAGTAMVYSDLDPYPPLYEGVSSDDFKALLLLVAGGFVGAFVLRLFSF